VYNAVDNVASTSITWPFLQAVGVERAQVTGDVASGESAGRERRRRGEARATPPDGVDGVGAKLREKAEWKDGAR
jgi:hypothetical protein